MKESILEMALETLKNKFQILQKELQELKSQLDKRPICSCSEEHTKSTAIELDELLTIREVQAALGVCYNTLQNAIVKKGLLTPKKISARKVRFSKKEVLAFINSLSTNPAKTVNNG